MSDMNLFKICLWTEAEQTLWGDYLEHNIKHQEAID
jgi:hypothetical protein